MSQEPVTRPPSDRDTQGGKASLHLGIVTRLPLQV